MKNKFIILLKKFFMYTTLIWSSAMLIVYISIIFELPVFALIGFIPFVGEFICDVLAFLLLFGIWGVPILYIITIPYILLVKEEEEKTNKRIKIATIIIPLVVAGLMLTTNFLEVLS